MNIFVAPVTTYFQFERSLFTLYVSAKYICAFIISLFFGKLKKGFNLKFLVVFGGCTIVISFVIFALSNSLMDFYIGGALLGIGYALTGVPSVSCIIYNWYKEKRGVVTGAVFATSGIAAMLLSPLLGQTIERYGWQPGYWLMGVLSLSILGFTIVFLHERPSDSDKGKFEGADTLISSKQCLTKLQRKEDNAVLIKIIIINLILGFALTAANDSMAACLQDVGYDIVFISSTMLILASFGLTAGKMFMGWLNDKAGILSVTTIGYGFGILGMLGFVIIQNLPLYAVLISVFCIGIGCTMITIPTPLMVSRLFDEERYASVIGICNAAFLIALAIGIPVSNYVYDITGSYRFAYGYEAMLSAIALLLCTQLSRNKKY